VHDDGVRVREGSVVGGVDDDDDDDDCLRDCAYDDGRPWFALLNTPESAQHT